MVVNKIEEVAIDISNDSSCSRSRSRSSSSSIGGGGGGSSRCSSRSICSDFSGGVSMWQQQQLLLY